jgi:hypothetical protein
MTWIESRMADLEAFLRRNAIIREHAVTIYDALWDTMVGHLDEAKASGFAVSTNGALQKRTVKLAKQNLSGNCFEFDLTLVDSKIRIRAHGDRVNVMLDLDVCPDGVVCLKLGGDRVSIEQAAIFILDPFLFPQLQNQR